MGSVSTIGHPARDEVTGLVPEAAAFDPDEGPESGFGDGVSVVAVTVEAPTVDALVAVAWVRPGYEDAPLDSIGRPMGSYQAQGAREWFRGESRATDAVAWLVSLGVTESYASERVAAALTTAAERDELRSRIALVAAQLPVVSDVELESLVAEARLRVEDPSRAGQVELVEQLVRDHPAAVVLLQEMCALRRS